MNDKPVSLTDISKEQIKDDLLVFLCRQFMVDMEDIEVDKSLIDTGIIDSIGLIEISSYIERNYNFKISAEQMNRQNFGSPLLIVDFIKKNMIKQQ